jgi:hypothetical protein
MAVETAAVELMGRLRKVQASVPVPVLTPCGFVEAVLC